MKWLLGSIGFVCFVLSDYNTVKLNRKSLKALFPIGCFLVLAGTGIAVYGEMAISPQIDGKSVIAAMLAVVSGGLLLYTLFFAVPFSESYIEGSDHRRVCKTGMYGFCRHPGVVWFFCFYMAVGVALSSRQFLGYGAFLSVWNLGYVIFQDGYSFPSIFLDYPEYKRQVPFLIPTKKSIIQGVRTWGKRGGKDAF